MFLASTLAFCSMLSAPAPAPGDILLITVTDPVTGAVIHVLSIEGLDDIGLYDQLEVVEDGTDLVVRQIGMTVGGFRTPASGVDRIDVALYSGNDIFDAHTIDIPMIVSGGWGHDTLRTGAANDFVAGDGGDDAITTNGGDDTIWGGPDFDTIDAGEGNDVVYGYMPVSSYTALGICYQDGDTIDGGPGSDYLEGGPDDDTIDAGLDTGLFTSVDTVLGWVPAPDDIVIVCSDDDVITAQNSVLVANGGPGADQLYGAACDDDLEGASGADQLYGNGGNDQLSGGTGPDLIDCGDGTDTASGGGGPDEIHGGAGDDLLNGNGDYDFIWGDSGNDTLQGGGGNDELSGGDGDDVLHGDGGDDNMQGDSGNDQLLGGTGFDDLFGGSGDDALVGGDGQDRLWGEDGSDLLVGGVSDSDSDELSGGDGADRLYGGGGADSLSGDDGDDLLVSVDDAHDDALLGGSGFDSFWYDPRESPGDASSAETESNVHEVKRIENLADYTWDGDDVADPNLESVLHYANFSSPPTAPRWSSLFGSAGPLWTDIHQGGVGSCWLLAGLAAAASVNQNVIRQAIIELPDGSFLVEWDGKHYRQDADLPVDASGNLVYAGLGGEDALWVAVFEKAVADMRFGALEILTFGEYDSVAVGTPAETFRKLGGDGRSLLESLIVAGLTLTQDSMASYIEGCLAANEAVACTTLVLIRSQHLYSQHAYMVRSVIRDSSGRATAIEVYNPWGVDVKSSDLASGKKLATGSNDDGIVEVPLREFFNSFKLSPIQLSISDFSRFDE